MRYLLSTILILVSVTTIGKGQDDPSDAVTRRRLYLDEFRPVPQLEVARHPLTRSKFPCINMHAHPGRLSGAELRELASTMDTANVAVGVSLDGAAGGRVSEHLEKLNQNAPGRFVVFVRMDYIGDGDADDFATWDVNEPGYGQRMADKLTESVRLGAC